MLTRHKLFAAAIALLGAFGLMATTAGSASAGVYHTSSYHKATYNGITVQVWENGDVVKVCDTSSNGYAAQVSWGIGGSYYGPLRVTQGKGSCQSRGANTGHNLAERERIWVNMAGTRSDAHEWTFYNDH